LSVVRIVCISTSPHDTPRHPSLSHNQPRLLFLLLFLLVLLLFPPSLQPLGSCDHELDDMVAPRSGDDFPPVFMRSSVVHQSQDAEIVHKDALDAARAEHERIREAAIRAFQNNEIRVSQSYLRDAAAQEAERLELEREHAELAARVIELQRTHIPIPTPPPREPTPPPAPAPKPAAPQKLESPKIAAPAPKSPAPAPNIFQAPAQQVVPPNASSIPQITNGISSNTPQEPVVHTRPPETKQPQTPSETVPAHILPGTQRYTVIHKNLKQLRKFMTDSAKNNPPLKSKMGEMRRSIRTAVGQLTEGQGVNKIPVGREERPKRMPLINYRPVKLETH